MSIRLSFFQLLSIGLATLAMTGSVFAQELPAPMQAIKITQRLGEQIPLNLEFRDEYGTLIKLDQYFADKPVILVLAYYRCPRLCSRVLNSLARTIREMSLQLGRDYRVITVSFDSQETHELAHAKKEAYLQLLGTETADWHFLTGDEDNIQRLAKSVGFRFFWDEKTNQYQHTTAIMVLTPSGEVARYFFGIDYARRDVQFGLQEAAQDRIGTPVDRALLLTCFAYDPAKGAYVVVAYKLMRTGAVLTVMVIAGFVGWNWWRARPSDIKSAKR